MQSAEFVCSKAVRDGVIDAVIDHKNGWVQSQDVVDVYATDEPQQVCVRVRVRTVFSTLASTALRRPLCQADRSMASVSAGIQAGAGAGACCARFIPHCRACGHSPGHPRRTAVRTMHNT